MNPVSQLVKEIFDRCKIYNIQMECTAFKIFKYLQKDFEINYDLIIII